MSRRVQSLRGNEPASLYEAVSAHSCLSVHLQPEETGFQTLSSESRASPPAATTEAQTEPPVISEAISKSISFEERGRGQAGDSDTKSAGLENNRGP